MAGEFDDLFDAASRPQAWPVFGFQVEEIKMKL